ncbi:MAG: hypothetical protein QM483_04640 [Desulfuromusa sp.]
MNTIHFLLTPDHFASRHLRRYVTQNHNFLGIVVGTFSELLEQVRIGYLLKKPEDIWQEKLLESALKKSDAFWSRSLKLYPRETTNAVEKALSYLLEGSFPDPIKIPTQWDDCSVLATKHFNHLIELHSEMGCILPSHLETAGNILKKGTTSPPTIFRVYVDSNYVELKHWQSKLVDKINADGTSIKDKHLSSLYQHSIDTFQGHQSGQSKTIQHCVTNLFVADSGQINLDSSLQFIAARDYLEEAEVVATQVRNLLADNTEVAPSDIALLLPADQRYALAVKEAFLRVEIPLSGLSWEPSQRDLGYEVLFHYLMVVKKPVSIIAWAALLTSPFMPWTPDTGHVLAQRIVNRQFDLEKMSIQTDDERTMLTLLEKNHQKSSPLHLLEDLKLFKSLLVFDDDQEKEQQRVEAAFDQCESVLQGTGQIDWNQLRQMTTPETLKGSFAEPITREGVAVFLEGGHPWRTVKHLFVLGFGEGHYPQTPGHSSVFIDQDLDKINQLTGSTIETSQQIIDRRRRLLKYQLGSATETISFSFARMSPQGKSQQPSSTLPFIAALFNKIDAVDDLFLELDHQEDRNHIHWLLEKDAILPVPPRSLEISDLNLSADLLCLNIQKDGEQRKQSPSSLANLMTSPLAWLLNWVGVQSLDWAPETMDPATKGTLAHEVFEFLFLPDTPLPTVGEINVNVPQLLHRAIIHNVPFLLATEWQVERNHLESDVLEAALHWRQHLEATGMRVVGNEIRLEGELDGVPLKGFADVIMSLPDGRIIIGDYKKSRSAKRIKQMESSFDSQASLYRIMLEKGTISTKQDISLPDKLSASNIGVLYYTLNDQMIMIDTHDWLAADSNIKELGSDIASEAMSRLKARFDEVRKGQIQLNFVEDEKVWDKVGIKLYCLDNSPLLRMYMHTEEVSS